ncbi:hypothetical protein PVAND_014427 [Polypedilum vanderplanki]|uniref:Zinc finger protein n=1 Tax=Polypedilum vanderplanki TaxID=319348 RepID=A0A9J6B9U9_POLVA|nr:hypothetical protein PVAND_014427 [Polypedilum vanderplanki]
MSICFVPGCQSSTYRARRDVSLFRLTKDPDRRKLWIDIIEKEMEKNLREKDCSKKDPRICSLHFKEDDYQVKIDKQGAVKRFLKVDAVPSVFKNVNEEDDDKNSDYIIKNCRICFRRLPAVSNCSLYENLPNVGLSTVDILGNIFDLKLNLNDNLPSRVCAICQNNILTAYNLKSRIIQTEESLKNLLKAIVHDEHLNDSKKTCTKLVLKHLEKSEKESRRNQAVENLKRNSSNKKLVYRKDKLVYENHLSKSSESEPIADIEIVKCKPDVKPTFIFEEIEMNSNQTTFFIENSDSSSFDVTVNKCEGIIELSSDEEKEKSFSEPTTNSQHNNFERQYEQWPEEIQKQLEKQQKLKNKTCKKCNYLAKNMKSLHKHIDNSSINCMEFYEPKFKCYICNKMFLMLKSKINHVNRDHFNEVRKECHLCQQSLRETPQTYENHLRKHFESPTHLCVQCGKGFYKNEYYLNHLREAHDDSYWFECDVCGNHMRNKQALMIHMRRHTKERPAYCDICSKNLFSVMSLKKHKFCVHKFTDQSIFRCEKCNYCYLFRKEFERHIVRCDGDGKNQKSQARIRYDDLVEARSVISR